MKKSIVLCAAVLSLSFLGSKCDRIENYLVRGPYLQRLDQDTVTVMWETSVASDSVVQYGTRQDQLYEHYDPRPVKEHSIRLRNLDEGTKYFYRLATKKRKSLKTQFFSFRTKPAAEVPFKFVAWADNQKGSSVFGNLANRMAYENPAFAISMGDVVEDGSKEHLWLRHFFNPAAYLLANVPFYIAAGNHDFGLSYLDKGSRHGLFDRYFYQPGDGHNFAFTYGAARFVILDAHHFLGAVTINPGSSLHDWLSGEMSSDEYRQAKFRFVFIHQPPFGELWEGDYYDGHDNLRKNLVPLLEASGASALFTGHLHGYERGEWNGVRYVVSGGGGGDLDYTFRKDWPQIEIVKAEHHYCSVEVGTDSAVVKVINPSGAVIDSFEIPAAVQ